MRRRVGFPLLVALSLALAACPAAPRTVEVYRNDGLHFSHFSDWKISEDRTLPANRKVREIVLHGPNEALLMLLCFPESSGVSLDSFAAGVAKGRAEGIKKSLGLGPITVGEESGNTTHATIAKIAGEDSAGVQQTFDLDVLGKKIPHQASYYMLHTGGRKLVIMAQVAIEHLATTRPGWQQVFDTVAIDP
ncbi:MAG TPA: hypothetical protein VGK45_17575 [Thermoanaerobaculia bacterium]